MALVAPREERAAGMGQKQLQTARPAAEQQDPRAHSFRHAVIVRATAVRSLHSTCRAKIADGKVGPHEGGMTALARGSGSSPVPSVSACL
jgi:hypothetical protein